jgi:hypothetical protein
MWQNRHRFGNGLLTSIGRKTRQQHSNNTVRRKTVEFSCAPIDATESGMAAQPVDLY